MWKPEHRLAADRRGLRYPSDLTDAEWGIVAPMIPPGRHGGRKRSVNVREVLNGIFYVLWTGCQWPRSREKLELTPQLQMQWQQPARGLQTAVIVGYSLALSEVSANRAWPCIKRDGGVMPPRHF